MDCGMSAEGRKEEDEGWRWIGRERNRIAEGKLDSGGAEQRADGMHIEPGRNERENGRHENEEEIMMKTVKTENTEKRKEERKKTIKDGTQQKVKGIKGQKGEIDRMWMSRQEGYWKRWK